MKNILFMFPLLFILNIATHSQVSGYGYAKTTSTYAYNASPTVIHAVGINDAISAAINIGFTFAYNNSNYTQFKASTNGFITFNIANTLSQPTNNLKTSTERSIVAPLWDDNQTGASGNVNYKLTGTTPNRILTIEWKALRWNKSGFSAGTIDTQIKLYETTNVIEFIYNRGTYQSFSNSSGIGASIGLSGSTSGDFMSISDLKPSPTSSTITETTTIGASPTNLLTKTADQATTAIPNGTLFRFTTPPPVALPISLSSFIVESDQRFNKLSWTTESEYNNDYFNIEKTLNGETFENIGYIKGAGNSTQTNTYSFTDYNSNGDINYYRLKQTDYDGKFIYSDLISMDTRIKAKIISRMVSLMGTEVNEMYRGIVIVEYTDGSIEKIIR